MTTDKIRFTVNDPMDAVNNFLNCLNTGTLSDIVLVAGDKEISCHRFILSASSSVFEAMLNNNCWSEFSSKRVVLYEPAECLAVFERFIQYMYCGRIDVSLGELLPILLLADKYNVRGLVHYCWEYMLDHVINSVQNNCIFDWMAYAKGCGRYDIYEAFHQFVRLNFEFVKKKSNLNLCDLDTFCSIISHSDLVVTNEFTLFYIAESWLLHHLTYIIDETERKKMVLNVLGCLRYPMMTSRQLAALAISPFAQKYNEFLVNRMALGMSYHFGRLSNKDLKSEPNGILQIYPRIYTDDSVSSQATVEFFKALPKYHKLTLVFSTNTSSAECDGEKICEWIIELSLKGIIIEKGLLISYEVPPHIVHPNLTVPGCVSKQNRLSITCKDPPPGESLRVRICTILYGTLNSEMCVLDYKELVHHFNEENRMIHINNIVPYDEDNTSKNGKTLPRLEPYFVGPDRDAISMRIVIVPLAVLQS